MSNGKQIELTNDHLIKTNNGFVHAHKLKIGGVLTSNITVEEITHGISHVVSPLTVAGTIIINDVVVSCYAVVKCHYLADFVYIPVKLRMITGGYIESYTAAIVNIHNILPAWIKYYLHITNVQIIAVT
jgi:hypothetical protein